VLKDYFQIIHLNELLSGHSSRLDIFLHPKMLRYQSCECPHRLSDKLLKSGAISGSACCCEVAYITLSSFRVNPEFQDF
ncbi:hypothetical protein, partial [Cedecea colo]|uniref:hypothetical protein n=1 Tax=Cedecea colo TaxID=2552946 RepID=UPI001F243289